MIKKEFNNLRFSSGESFKEKLNYNNIPTWWLFDILFYLDKKPQYVSNKYMNHLLLEITSKFIVFLSPISKIIYTAFGIGSSQHHNLHKLEKPLLMTPTIPNRWTLNKNKANVDVNHPYYDNIFTELNGNLDIHMGFWGLPSPKTFIQYFMTKKYYQQPIDALVNCLSLDIFKKSKLAYTYFRNLYHDISNDTKWVASAAQLCDKSVVEFLELLKFHLTILVPFRIDYYYLLESTFLKYQPNVIFLVGEQTAEGRCWTHIAKKNNIPVIALQHGIILADDIAYFNHSLEDLEPQSHCPYPIPDLTLVWGEADATTITKYGYYPQEKIQVVGNPRYDNLKYVSIVDAQTSICSNYQIPPDNKIILWTPQSHGNSMDENKQYIYEIISSITNLEKVTLLIKPHPSEDENLLKEMIEAVISEGMQVDYHYAHKTENTTKLIAASDLLIIKNSTTGQEAIALKKPLVVLDFSESFDDGKYVSENVAIGVSSPGELKKVILDVLSNPSILYHNYDLYVRQHLYKLDGKSAQRCAHIITSFVNKNKI